LEAHALTTIWLLAAAVAGQLAWVAAPLARGEVGAWWLHVLAPAALLTGLSRRSPGLLLVGVPMGWACAAYAVPGGGFSGGLSVVAAATALAWFVAALRWLRGTSVRETMDWTARDEATSAGRDPLPWVAACLVGGPALGVVLWPAIPRAAAAGFPGHAGHVTVALALLATLVGLALATDLSRGRYAMSGSPRRAGALAVVAAATIGLWAGVST